MAALDLDPVLLPPDAELRNLAVTGTSIDPTQRPALDALDPPRFDHVIVLADDRVSQSDADSRTLVTVLHLRDIKNRAGGDFAIVSELNDDNNRRLAQVTRVDDFIVGRRMINLILVQLAKCPDRKGILAELFDAHGADIYLEPAEHYATLHVETTFAAIIRTTAERGETVIGLRLQADAGRPPAYGIRLNPPRQPGSPSSTATASSSSPTADREGHRTHHSHTAVGSHPLGRACGAVTTAAAVSDAAERQCRVADRGSMKPFRSTRRSR